MAELRWEGSREAVIPQLNVSEISEVDDGVGDGMCELVEVEA